MPGDKLLVDSPAGRELLTGAVRVTPQVHRHGGPYYRVRVGDEGRAYMELDGESTIEDKPTMESDLPTGRFLVDSTEDRKSFTDAVTVTPNVYRYGGTCYRIGVGEDGRAYLERERNLSMGTSPVCAS